MDGRARSPRDGRPCRRTARFLAPAREMPDNAIFISYAREDLARGTAAAQGTGGGGGKRGFDMERLESGRRLRPQDPQQHSALSFFLPVVSATTERRLEAYFRREWSYAIDRSRNMADGALFILPVCVDETDCVNGHVPEKFKALHFTRLLNGEVTPEFTARLR